MNKAVLLDRDNTLIVDSGYVHKLADLKWKIGAKAGLVKLAFMGFKLIVITNQSGVARGFYTEKEVDIFHQHMNTDLFNSNGIIIDKYYYSPYHPEGKIEKYRKITHCRKPGKLLFKKALKEYDIIASKSIAIGDNYSDIKPAFDCGLKKAFLINDKKNLNILPNNVKVVKNWKEITKQLDTL